MTAEDAKAREFMVIHRTDADVRIYNWQEGWLKRTTHGLEFTVPPIGMLNII